MRGKGSEMGKGSSMGKGPGWDKRWDSGILDMGLEMGSWGILDMGWEMGSWDRLVHSCYNQLCLC